MRITFCRWCLFLVQSRLMFAVASSVPTSESTSASEASTTPLSTSPTVLSSAPVTTKPTTIVTPTSLPTTTTSIVPPSPPSNVIVSSLKPVGLQVLWTVSPNNSAYYIVSHNNTDALHTNGSNCTLLDLLGGSYYVIGVRACFQDSICSDSANGRNITYPSMPGNLELTGQSNNSLSIKWEQYGGFSGFSVNVNYHGHLNVTDAIQFTPLHSNDNITDNITVVRCEIGGLLTPGGNYTVEVSAMFESLLSDFQNGSFLTQPYQPRNVTLFNRTVDSLWLKWLQFGVVKRFLWHANDTNEPQGDAYPPTDIGDPADCYPCNWTMSLGIHNLSTAGEMYLIQVNATVSNVTSDPLTVSYPTAPPAISSVSCMGPTNATLSVQIAIANTNSYRLDGYVISYSPVTNYSANMTDIYLDANATLVNLTAGLMYTVEAKTTSFSVYGDPARANCSTIPNVPENFSSTTDTSVSVNLWWTRPAGHLQHYELVYTNDSSHESSKSISESEPTKPYKLYGLSSDSNYTFKLSTLSFDRSSGNETTSSWTLSEKVSDIHPIPHETSVDVTWNSPVQHNNVFLYNLYIYTTTHCLQLVIFLCDDRTSSFPNVFFGNCSSTKNATGSCESGKMSHSFTDLTHSTNYEIAIAAVNPGGSSEAGKRSFTTLTVPNYDWIAGVVFGCLFGVLLIIALVILFLRWRNDKPPFSPKKPSSIGSIIGAENPTYEDEPEPLAVEAFVDHVKKMSQDSNYLYACEYMLLAKLSPKNSTVAAELPDNRSKNRYTDILPFDNSRVKLIPEDDVDEGDSSDYINASFLPGFNSVREYIAAQGPMRSTVDSFWLMIWQQKVSTIVMVTNLSERGREKCEQYWPEDDEPLCYGNINVQLKSESSQDFYVIRALEVSSESEKRQVFQYHFLTWPDFGIPEDIEHILTFVRDIRNSFQGNAPLLVHCSAGVGRTGTFIVVDHLLQLIKKEQWIDLFHIVLELRQHRPKMIQAESQYVFAHECIKTAIEKGLHRGSLMHIAEDEQANGDCLYANASETANVDQLYANASEFHEQSV